MLGMLVYHFQTSVHYMYQYFHIGICFAALHNAATLF